MDDCLWNRYYPLEVRHDPQEVFYVLPQIAVWNRQALGFVGPGVILKTNGICDPQLRGW
jgi:hypothetical protein